MKAELQEMFPDPIVMKMVPRGLEPNTNVNRTHWEAAQIYCGLLKQVHLQVELSPQEQNALHYYNCFLDLGVNHRVPSMPTNCSAEVWVLSLMADDDELDEGWRERITTELSNLRAVRDTLALLYRRARNASERVDRSSRVAYYFRDFP